MIKILIGLIAGVVLGYLCPVAVTGANAKLFSVILLVALDSLFGGLRAALKKNFNDALLISGFTINAVFAGLLVLLGENLALDLFYVVLIILGLRIFKNLAALRRHLLKNL